MKKYLFLLLLMLPLTGTTAERIDLTRVVGTYVGQVVNGGGIYEVTTEFSVLPDGRVRGEYRVNGENPLRGYMSGPMPLGDNRISWEWQDRDGEGYAELQFSDDYSEFDGFWSDYSSNNEFPWNGERQ